MGNAFMDETLAKCHALVHLMEQRNLEGIVLETPPNQMWLLPTIEPYTPLMAESTKVLVYISRSGKLTIVGPDNEVPQILAKDVAPLEAESYVYPWYQDGRRAIARTWTKQGRVGSEGLTPNTLSVAHDLEMLRVTLSTAEQRRYRQLGSACAGILTDVLQGAAPGITEADLAGRVAAQLLPEGIIPEVLLVGSDERLTHFRHPHTTLKSVQRHVMITLTARRAGLYVSLSRARYFGKLPTALAQQQLAAAQVDATLLSLSRPGVSLLACYEAAVHAYAKAGYPGEAQRHHQGGTTGYRGRERRAHPGETWSLMAQQAVAWNPTVRGAKSEDTALVHPESLEILSVSAGWPVLHITVPGGTFERPAIMAD